MRDHHEDLKNLFKKDARISYDFSRAPKLIILKNKNTESAELFEGAIYPKWAKGQRVFLGWTRDKGVFTEEYVENSKAIYDSFFKVKGYMRGKIIDIGGGWGLFRQWWEPGSSGIFVVHDPGVERFLRGPHRHHQLLYQRAFTLPMTFVEGFGESHPYKDCVFDTCLIAAALDHCINPARVLAEAYRCLKPEGTIIIFQTCRSSQSIPAPHFLTRLFKLLAHPTRLPTKVYRRFFQVDEHLHHFVADEITLLLEQAGFSEIHIKIISTKNNVYAFEAKK